MEVKPYRWIQVVTSIVESDSKTEAVTLIATTTFDNKNDGIDELVLRHRMQLGNARVTVTFISYMGTDGEMSGETLPLWEGT